MCSNVLLLLFFVSQAADENVFSGPQVGEKLVAFEMINALFPDASRPTLTVPEANDRPQLLIFVHERSRPAFGLSNTVMKLAADRGAEKLAASLIYLSADPTEAATWMKNVSKNFPKGIHSGVFSGGIEGPEAYGLNRKVAVTVLVAKNNTVIANFAMVQPSLEVDAPKIFKAIADVLGEPNVAKVSDFQPQVMNVRRATQPAQQDPNLRPLLKPLIQKTATEEDVAAAATKIEEYAAEHPEARLQIGDIARRIIDADKLSNYGTAACQKYLKKWATQFIAVDGVKKDMPENNESTPSRK